MKYLIPDRELGTHEYAHVPDIPVIVVAPRTAVPGGGGLCDDAPVPEDRPDLVGIHDGIPPVLGPAVGERQRA